MPRSTGRVKKFFAEKGFGFISCEGRREDVFVHRSQLKGLDLTALEGQTVSFEIKHGPKGDEATKIALVGAEPTATAQPPAETFVHAYNFVSVPEGGLGIAAAVEPFQRHVPATHDCLLPDRISGRLDCRLTTESPWFIPDARKVNGTVGQHRSQGYFTLDPVDASLWKSDFSSAFGKDMTAPAVPASSIRGMVRSVFEAATLSCFSVFDGGRLDYRVGWDLGDDLQRRSDPPARYLPARIVQIERDDRGAARGATLEILEGRSTSERNLRLPMLPVALVRAFETSVGDVGGTETHLWQKCGLSDGDAVAAILEDRATEHGTKFQYRRVTAIAGASEWSKLPGSAQVTQGHRLVFGYLHRTGPNIEKKHFERLFFDWHAGYNDPKSSLGPAQRLQAFLNAAPTTVPVGAEVINNAEAALAGYWDRNGDGALAPTPRRLKPGKIQPSDFVTRTHSVKARALGYALLKGEMVVGFYPVAIPRLSHEDTRDDLLPDPFKTCEVIDSLCPACRVFGWVRSGKADADSAVSGHVRFSHGVLADGDVSWRSQLRSVTLPILGQPKPTTTAFYLKTKTAKDTVPRWPAALGKLPDGFPLYRTSEAVLRGRKMYRRQQNPNLSNHVKKDKQNQTVALCPPKMSFGFSVWFSNLTKEELGALVFSIHLTGQSEPWTDHRLSHQLGRGKPLGLGACSVAIEGASLTQKERSRYSAESWAGVTGDQIVAAEDWQRELRECGRSFEQAWKTLEERTNLIQVRDDLLEMLRSEPPGAPMYPPVPPGKGGFVWFQRNARGVHKEDRVGLQRLLPVPVDERDPEKRLPREPTAPKPKGRTAKQ